jgi:hypothetical protein
MIFQYWQKSRVFVAWRLARPSAGFDRHGCGFSCWSQPRRGDPHSRAAILAIAFTEAIVFYALFLVR